jgi:hypothetical protein
LQVRGAAMQVDLATFLVTVYCVVDDLYRERFAAHKPRRRGHRPELADSEVLTVAILAQWQQGRSERALLRYATDHWQAFFPRLLSQSAFNRRGRDLAGVLAALGPALALQVAAHLESRSAYEVWDGVPVPLARRCRGGKRRLFGPEAGFGRGGSDREWYSGMHLLAAVDAAGLITGFVVGPADTSEYWLAEALLRWRADPAAPVPTADELAGVLGPRHCAGGARRGPSGPLWAWLGAGVPATGPLVGDLGFRGRRWREHWHQAYGARLLTKADYATIADAAERAAWTAWLCGLRQGVETVFNRLTETLGVKFPRARSAWGVWTRLGAKVAAHNLAVWVNLLFDRPAFAVFNPLG